MIVVLDSGGIDSFTPSDAIRRAALRRLVESDGALLLPAAVLAERVFSGKVSRDHHVR